VTGGTSLIRSMRTSLLHFLLVLISNFVVTLQENVIHLSGFLNSSVPMNIFKLYSLV
jgi:hypothetical protein